MKPEHAPALSVLRAATREQHRGLEALLPIARPEADAGTYARYAAAMFGWLAPFEAALWSAPWPGELARGRDAKASWLIEDLAAAGLDPSRVPRCQHAPPLASEAQRFGVAYVLEGATLGGQSLLRTLGPRLAPWPLRFLRGYGTETGPRFAALLAALEERLATDAARAEAGQAAAEAFGQLAGWLPRAIADGRTGPGI